MLLALAIVAMGTGLLLGGLALAAAVLSSQCARREEQQAWQGLPQQQPSAPPQMRRSA